MSLIEYIHDAFCAFNAINLSIEGNKYKIKGYKRPNKKLEIESVINAI